MDQKGSFDVPAALVEVAVLGPNQIPAIGNDGCQVEAVVDTEVDIEEEIEGGGIDGIVIDEVVQCGVDAERAGESELASAQLRQGAFHNRFGLEACTADVVERGARWLGEAAGRQQKADQEE